MYLFSILSSKKCIENLLSSEMRTHLSIEDRLLTDVDVIVYNASAFTYSICKAFQ